MERTSFSISKDKLDEINSHLEYGDNRSAWVRDAVEMKLEILEILDEDMTDDERRELVVEAVRDRVEGEE